MAVEDRGRSGFARVQCPGCPDRIGKIDYKRSVSVNLENGWWRCWRCDLRGRLPGDWEDEDEWDDGDGWEDVEEEDDVEEPSDYLPLAGSTSRAVVPAIRFLRKRGVPPEVWGHARLGYARVGDHKHRVIMPIWAPDGRSLGWVGRHVAGGWPAYYTASGMDRRRLFYNDAALGQGNGPLLVTEGPLDALRHWPTAIAALGKPTDDHFARLLEFLRTTDRPVVTALDGDAWEEGLGLAVALRVHSPNAFALRLPHAEDLDTTDPELVRAGVAYALEHRCDVDLTEP